MRAIWILFKTVLVAAVLAMPVLGADIAVSEECSLADAITAANTDEVVGGCPAGDGADVITLTADVTLNWDLPSVASDIIVKGGGHSIRGDSYYRIFFVEANGTLSIERLTMQYGKVGEASISSGWTFESGGAIYSDGVLNISNSIFNGNSAESGGAIFNNGELNVSHTAFSNNSTDLGGGAISNFGELSIANSTFHNNVAVKDAEIHSYGGAILNYGKLSVSYTAFTYNATFSGGGAISNFGELSVSNAAFSENTAGWGGAIVSEGVLSVSNSTFSENRANVGGGIFLLGDETRHSTTSLTHITLARNWAEEGGAIHVYTPDYAIVNLRNSVISGETGSDCMGALNSSVVNLIEDGSCDADISDDPMLGDLIEPEDGSPAYFPLLPGSPAIDAANSDFCPDSDQIGTARPQGDGCDIGAIEFVPEN